MADASEDPLPTTSLPSLSPWINACVRVMADVMSDALLESNVVEIVKFGESRRNCAPDVIERGRGHIAYTSRENAKANHKEMDSLIISEQSSKSSRSDMILRADNVLASYTSPTKSHVTYRT